MLGYPTLLRSLPCSPPLPAAALDITPQVLLPLGCEQFTPRMVRLAKLAVALQAHAGEGACFALSARTAAEYLGNDAPSNAWTVLQLLCNEGFLDCVDRGVPGRGGKAAQYVLGDLGLRASMGKRR